MCNLRTKAVKDKLLFAKGHATGKASRWNRKALSPSLPLNEACPGEGRERESRKAKKDQIPLG
jgi:hypothetical protein